MKTDDLRAESVEEPTEENIVCCACLEINTPRRNYCAKCSAPLNALLAFNPFDQTLIEGFAYRRAVEGPASKVVLIGMWLIFFPGAVSLPWALASNYWHSPGVSALTQVFRDAARDPASSVFFLFYMAISWILLYRTTANYFSSKRRSPSVDA